MLTAEECVRDMREIVYRETKLTVSAGIAPNKARYIVTALRYTCLRSLSRCSQKYVKAKYLPFTVFISYGFRYVQTKLVVSFVCIPASAHSQNSQNKPNGQFQLEFEADAIKEFMRDLSIRKIPGIGRVTERLLEAIGIKVIHTVKPATNSQMINA